MISGFVKWIKIRIYKMMDGNDILLNVLWDTTSDEYPEGEPGVKTEQVIGVPYQIYKMDEVNDFQTDYVTNFLSNEYGWCVLDWGNY